MKRISLVLALAAVLCFVFVGSAFANFGPHGGYATDTDSCAGCHRAHSSASSIKFTGTDTGTGNNVAQPYALLVGNASKMAEFCEACHGDLAPGASTNVQSGRFDSGPSGAAGIAAGVDSGSISATDTQHVVVQYETNSTFNAPLNGGGFGSVVGGRVAMIADTATYEAGGGTVYKPVTSTHSMEYVGTLWGAGNSVNDAGSSMYFTCTSCHDPHGSSNYRLLRDTVNGHPKGGYDPVTEAPSGIVYSNEVGYDAVIASNGWLRHVPGAGQMANYRPNYTSGSSQIRSWSGLTGGAAESLSGWCSGCHEQYNNQQSAYDYGTNEPAAMGGLTRHRHPVAIAMNAANGILQLPVKEDARIPLEQTGDGTTFAQNQIGCLTCHFAHGSTATMSGWSNAHLVLNQNNTFVPEKDATMGVSPDKVADPMVAYTTVDEFTGTTVQIGTSALLRADNRGVCNRCHNK